MGEKTKKTIRKKNPYTTLAWILSKHFRWRTDDVTKWWSQQWMLCLLGHFFCCFHLAFLAAVRCAKNAGMRKAWTASLALRWAFFCNCATIAAGVLPNTNNVEDDSLALPKIQFSNNGRHSCACTTMIGSYTYIEKLSRGKNFKLTNNKMKSKITSEQKKGEREKKKYTPN